MYAEMSPEEKEGWNQRAEADKNRFLLEMASYVPSPGVNTRGDAVLAVLRAGGYRSRTSRDSNAPKRNLSAYLLYQNAMRDQFKIDNPGMTFGQLSKYTSHMYKSLTAQEKAEWDLRSQQDKARFENEMTTYVPPPGHDAQGNLLDDRPTVRRMKKPKDPNAPKRARGSFVFFTFEMRPKIMVQFPIVKFVEMGTLMGERWRALTPEEKSVYINQAKADKERFTKEMQEYTVKKAEAVARSHLRKSQFISTKRRLTKKDSPRKCRNTLRRRLKLLRVRTLMWHTYPIYHNKWYLCQVPSQGLCQVLCHNMLCRHRAVLTHVKCMIRITTAILDLEKTLETLY